MPATNTTPPDTALPSTALPDTALRDSALPRASRLHDASQPGAADNLVGPPRPDRATHWPSPPRFDTAPAQPAISAEPSLIVTLNRSGFDAPGQTGGAASMAGLRGGPGTGLAATAASSRRVVPKPIILVGLCAGMAALVGITFLLVGLITGSDGSRSEAAEAQSSTVPSTSQTPSTQPAVPPAVDAEQPAPTEPPPTTAAPVPEPEPLPKAEPTPEPEPLPEPVAASRSAAYIGGVLYLQGTVASQAVADDIFTRAEAVLGEGTVVSEYVVDPNTFVSGDIRLIIEDTVLFDSGSAFVGETNIALLDLSLALLNSHESVTITLIGHTDSLGGEEQNAQLAHQRLESVMDYFVDNGIDPSRIDTQNRGESGPVASNDTEAGRAQNRRVEIIIHNAFEE